MKKVTIRVPATTANLGPGFDAFGCALSLYTDVTFEETESGLEITGCEEEYTGPDNLAYVSYCAVLASLSEEVRGVKIHIQAQIPIGRGLGSSAALLVAGAMGANVLRGNKLSTQGLLNITNAMEGHPDNLAPAFYGGLTASMVDNGLPVTVNFPLHMPVACCLRKFPEQMLCITSPTVLWCLKPWSWATKSCSGTPCRISSTKATGKS